MMQEHSESIRDGDGSNLSGISVVAVTGDELYLHTSEPIDEPTALPLFGMLLIYSSTLVQHHATCHPVPYPQNPKRDHQDPRIISSMSPQW